MKLIKSIKSQWNQLSFKYKMGLVIASIILPSTIGIPFFSFLLTEKRLVQEIGEDLLKLGQCNLLSQKIQYTDERQHCNSYVLSTTKSENIISSIQAVNKYLEQNKKIEEDTIINNFSDISTLVNWLKEIQKEAREKNQSIDILVDDVYLFTIPPSEDDMTWKYIASSGFDSSSQLDKLCENTGNKVCFGDQYKAGNLIKSLGLGDNFKKQASYGKYIYQNKQNKHYFITSTLPIFQNEGDTEPIAILAIDFNANKLQEELTNLQQVFMIVGLAAAVSLVSISTLIADYFTRPIAQLEEASKKLAGGDLSVQVKTNSQDELGKLSHAFNQMAERLEKLLAEQIRHAEEKTEFQKNREIQKLKDEDLKKGRNIQNNFLPHQIPQYQGWEIEPLLDSTFEVSGDFYDVFALENGNLCLVIGDVCDKGVGAALFMGLFRSLLRIYAQQNTQPISSSRLHVEVDKTNPEEIDMEVLNTLKAIVFTNDYIANAHQDIVMFATLFFGVLNPQTGVFTYVSGGHEVSYIINSSGIKYSLERTGPAVGAFPNAKFKIKQVQLEIGDVLIAYTDGVTDARNPDNQSFGKERLRSLLSEHPPTSALELKGRIIDNVSAFIDDHPQFDDITLLICAKTS